MHLGAVIHAALLGPAFLSQSDHSVGKLKNNQRIIIALSFVGVHAGAHLGIH